MTQPARRRTHRARGVRHGTDEVRSPGLLLGVGLGGLVDGILLHQVLQWHHLLASSGSDRAGVPTYPVDTIEGLQVNTLWDGLFHLASLVAVLAGLGLLSGRLARGVRAWAARALWGRVLMGWGLFNLVEGVVSHHLLGIHHVRPGPQQVWWDAAFLVLGAVLFVGGRLVARGGGSAARGAEPLDVSDEAGSRAGGRRGRPA